MNDPMAQVLPGRHFSKQDWHSDDFWVKEPPSFEKIIIAEMGYPYREGSL